MKIAAAILLASQFEKDELVNLTYMFWMNGAENDIEISTAAACDASSSSPAQMHRKTNDQTGNDLEVLQFVPCA